MSSSLQDGTSLHQTSTSPDTGLADHTAESDYQKFKENCYATLDSNAPPVASLMEDKEHWKRSFGLMKQHDTEMCKRLGEDIDTLLVFIGLFAAVVAAFTIESYQWLQPESEDLDVQILLQISAQLDDSTAPVASVPDSFSPSSSSKSINILWFLSLSIALLTALLAIISKQWLHEYAKDVTPLPYEAAVAVRQLRLEAFQYWKVESIISSLPVLLQLSLLLFFAGLLDLLWTRDRTIALIITCVVGVGVTFVISTTFFPVIVAVANELLYYRVKRTPSGLVPESRDEGAKLSQKQRLFNPIPLCAYKSPQSWLWVKLFFWWITDPAAEFLWMHLEGRWLRIQDIHDRTLPQFPTYRHAVSRAIYWVDQHYGGSRKVLVDLFHCFSDLDVSNVVSQIFEKLDPFSHGAYNFKNRSMPSEWIPLAYMSYNGRAVARIPQAASAVGEKLIRYMHSSWTDSSSVLDPSAITRHFSLFSWRFSTTSTRMFYKAPTQHSGIPVLSTQTFLYAYTVWSASLAPALKFIFECPSSVIENPNDNLWLEHETICLFGNMKDCLERICREDQADATKHIRFWMEAIIEACKSAPSPASSTELLEDPSPSRRLRWRRLLSQGVPRPLHSKVHSHQSGTMDLEGAGNTEAHSTGSSPEGNLTFFLHNNLAVRFNHLPSVFGHDQRPLTRFDYNIEKLARVKENRFARLIVFLMEHVEEVRKKTPGVDAPEDWAMFLEGCRIAGSGSNEGSSSGEIKKN